MDVETAFSLLRPRLKEDLDGKLDRPLWDGGPDQRTGGIVPYSRCEENVRITVSRARRGEVGMIHDIEHLHAELTVEVFRDFLHALVLEVGEIQIGSAGAA